MTGTELPAPPVVCPPGALPVPLYGRGCVRAWAYVDAADHAWAMKFRWHLHPSGYATRNVSRAETGGRNLRARMHRELLALDHGDRREVDHVNRDPLDNRRANLRVVTHKQNAHNQKVNARAGRTSRFRGVSLRKDTGRWQAYCRVDGRLRHLGFFATEAEAGEVAAAFRRENLSHTTD